MSSLSLAVSQRETTYGRPAAECHGSQDFYLSHALDPKRGEGDRVLQSGVWSGRVVSRRGREWCGRPVVRGRSGVLGGGRVSGKLELQSRVAGRGDGAVGDGGG